MCKEASYAVGGVGITAAVGRRKWSLTLTTVIVATGLENLLMASAMALNPTHRKLKGSATLF